VGVLAQDPATRRAIEAMALEEPPLTRQTFDTGTTIAVGVAAYWALATALKIKYVKGPLSIELNKKAADSTTVRALVQKLLGYLR
jgi:hypothetical protein